MRGGVSPRPEQALTEALRVELPAHGADPGLPRLPLLQLQVQLLLELNDVQAGAGRAGHLLHPSVVLVLPLPATTSTGSHQTVSPAYCQARAGPAPLTEAAGWR